MSLNNNRYLCLLLLAVSLLSACGGKEERKARYLEKGKSYLLQKNYDKARIEFKNVLQIDPKDAEAYQLLGEVEEATQSWSKAFNAYKKASELAPQAVEPRLDLARFYLVQYAALRARKEESAAANVLALATEQIGKALELEPGNLQALALQATIWSNSGDDDKAIAQLQQVLAKDSGVKEAAALLASLYDRRGRTQEAEEVLRRAIETSAEPVPLQLQLARFYRAHEDNAKAEAVLRKIIEAHPEELGYRVSLASLLATTGQLDKAEQVLRELIEKDPEETQRYLLLTEFLATHRGKDVAINELRQLIAQHPDMFDLQFALVRLYVSEGRKADAETLLEKIIADEGVEPQGLKARVQLARLLYENDPDSDRIPQLIDEVLAENPRDSEALLIRGMLAARKKDYESAVNDFRAVIKDQPNSVSVLQLLASAHLANGEKELAKDTLARAIEVAPGAVKPRLAMARLMAQGGDIDDAIVQVDEVLKRHNASKQALTMKYELLARKGDIAGLQEVVKQMQAVAPDAEGGFIGEARVRMAQKDYVGALKVLDQVLEKNPASVAALMTKTEALAAQGKYKEALPVAEALQKARPDLMEAYFRKGKLLQELGDIAGAIRQYEIAVEKAPDNADMLTTLVNLESRQEGGLDNAEARLKALLAENPDHPVANVLLGLVYMAKKEYEQAEQAFVRQKETNPATEILYSYLAEAKVGQGDMDGAAKALEEGLQRFPGSARLLIGLAGVRERQKEYEKAIALYERVLEKYPGNAISANNLAALVADYKTDPASLKKAVELAGALEKTGQPAFLDTAGWVYYRNGDYDRAIEVLERVVKKAPQIPVFQYHLGMAYLKKGDKDAARKYLSKAVGDDARYEGVEEARAILKDL